MVSASPESTAIVCRLITNTITKTVDNESIMRDGTIDIPKVFNNMRTNKLQTLFDYQEPLLIFNPLYAKWPTEVSLRLSLRV